MKNERREFRNGWGLHLFVAFGIAFSLYGAIVHFRSGGMFLSFGLGGLALLFAYGLAEGLMARVVLTPDHIEIVSGFRRTVIPKSELVGVSWAKGTPVTLERASGGLVRLPLGMGGPHPNTIRAWLRRPTRQGEAEGAK
jgi:hypothetical protein